MHTTFGQATRHSNFAFPRSPSPSIGRNTKQALNSSLMQAGVPVTASKSRSRTPTRIVAGVLKVDNYQGSLTNQ